MNKELEDHLYAQVARELAAKHYDPAPLARAAEKAAGNRDLTQSLYISFRVEQLAREIEQEARKSALEAQRNEQLAAERQRQQRVAEAKRTAKSFFKIAGIVVLSIVGFIVVAVIGLIVLGFILMAVT